MHMINQTFKKMFEKQLDVAAQAILSFESKNGADKKINLSGQKSNSKS